MEAVAQLRTSVSFISTSAASRLRTLRVSDEEHTRRLYLPRIAMRTSSLNRVDFKRSGVNLRKASLLPVFSGDEESPVKDPARSWQPQVSKATDGAPVASSQLDRGRGDRNKRTPSPGRDLSADSRREEPRGQLQEDTHRSSRRQKDEPIPKEKPRLRLAGESGEGASRSGSSAGGSPASFSEDERTEAKRALRDRQLASRGMMEDYWLDDRLLESEPFKREVVHLALRDELSSICLDVQRAFDLKADMDPGALADLIMKAVKAMYFDKNSPGENRSVIANHLMKAGVCENLGMLIQMQVQEYLLEKEKPVIEIYRRSQSK